MIVVKLFGLIGVDGDVRKIFTEEGTVRQVLDKVKQECPWISEQQVLEAIIFINKQEVTGKKRFTKVLKEGDELALFSPVSGG